MATHIDDQGPDYDNSASVTAPIHVLLEAHRLDATMAGFTLVFGNTMRLDDLGGSAETPPQCATSIPIPTDLAKAIAEEIKLSPSTHRKSTCLSEIYLSRR